MRSSGSTRLTHEINYSHSVLILVYNATLEALSIILD